jgi:hypothetical protein
MKIKNAFLYVLIGLSSFVNAQGDQPMRGPLNQLSNGVIDGVVVNDELPVSFVKPYEFVRSSDYVFSKRVYSRIDAREKINQSIFLPFDSFDGDEGQSSSYNPTNVKDVDNTSWSRDQSNWSLWTVILRHILLGDLTVFEVASINYPDVEDGYNLRYPVDKTPNLDRKDYFLNSAYRKKISSIISANGKGEDLKFPKASDAEDTITIVKTNQTLSAFIDSAVLADPDYSTLKAIDPADLSAWWDAALVNQTVAKGRVQMFAASNSIFAYNVKEDWYFDKELSVFEKRIICIAPVARYTYSDSVVTTERGDLLVYNKSGKAYIFDNGFVEYTDQWEEREMFWLYFPELRNVIVNYFVSNDKNDSDRMSFDELFSLRYYSGQIYKSSNRYDQEIQDYRHGVDALYEAEKFKDKMRNWEHDVWNF